MRSTYPAHLILLHSIILTIFDTGKGKVVPDLSQAPRYENVWRIGGIAPRIFNLGGDWLGLCSDRFTAGEKVAGTH
jgi:hypothetical protein